MCDYVIAYTKMLELLRDKGFVVISCVGWKEQWINCINERYIPNSKQIFLLGGDYEYSLEIMDNKLDAIFLRQSFNVSSKKINEILIPSSYGVIAGDINMEVCEPTDKPKISFCGSPDSHKSRVQLFRILQHSNDIICNFIFTNAPCMGKIDPEIEIKKSTFTENLRTSEFTFCPRGNGNFSIRFYEALLSGRIPVVVKSDNEMPFEKYINWKDYCVVSENESTLVQDIITFHKNNDLNKIQRQCKDIFKEYFIDNFDILLLTEILNCEAQINKDII
jgi:hypothetical protein